MKRNRKLFINSCIITILLFCFYYIGRYYISQDDCIYDTIRSLYGNEFNEVMEFKKDNEYRTLLVDDNFETCSIVGTKRVGLFYQPSGSIVGDKIKKDRSIEITGEWTRDFGMVLIIYRTNENVEKVIVEFEDGSKVTFNDWKQNFSGVLLDKDNWYNGIYKVYNTNNKLIEEIEY